MLRRIYILIWFLGLHLIILNAQPPIPDPAGRWIIDDADVISETNEQTISLLCQQEFDSTSNQVVVYIFNSLEGGTIEQYANDVFNQWEIGTKENNNGILLIVAISDRKMRIEVGYGLESFLTDLEASDIIENEIKPSFKKGDYNTGVLSGVQNIIYGIRNSYVAPINYEAIQPHSIYGRKSYASIWGFIVVLLAWWAVSIWFSRMKIGEGISASVFFWFMGGYLPFIFWEWYLVAFMLIGGLVFQVILNKVWKPRKYLKFWGPGGGGSWSSSSSYSYGSSSSSWSSGSSYSGGGFSGGGGSSGGGGASGSW